MSLNIGKCLSLAITRKKHRSNFSYTIDNCALTTVSNHKYLGITISNDLRWDTHIDNITGTALKRLFLLQRRLKQAPPNTKLIAYTTLVRSVLEYASPVWFPFTQQQINKIEAVQRKAIRFIFSR